MSGEGPESIPTSADRRSKRPVKKRALTPVSTQAAGLEALFAKPDQAIKVPVSADVARLRDTGAGAGAGAGAGTPEIISNVQGSSSGAGSGEFHVYKASRRREYARLRQLDEEAEQDRNKQEFEKARLEREMRDDEKTRRNREKREKAKARKQGKKGGGPAAAGAPKAPAQKEAQKPVITRPQDSDDDNDDSKKDGKDGNEATEPSTNGTKDHTTKAPEPVPVADGPGLLIQDDDD